MTFPTSSSRFLAAFVLLAPLCCAQPTSAAQAPIDLGEAAHFAVLAGSSVTSVPTSSINGDVGVSPSARSDIAGLTPVEVNGSIFAADDGGAVAVMLTKAKGDLTVAYNDAAGRTLNVVNIPNADLGGQTLAPGLYKSTGTLSLTGNVTLDAQGDPTAVFIFQIASSLGTSAGSKVILSGGASAANVFWQVGTSASLGTTTSFKGTIMADQSITLSTGSTLEGRALARIAAVTLDSSTITVPTPVAPVELVLLSSDTAPGPYANASGQTHDAVLKKITVPAPSDEQFYRIRSAAAVTILSISISGNHAVLFYN